MCGIVGLVDFESSPESDEVDRMNECLSHRGPDSHGIFLEDSVALGHNRLSIIDLDTGQQPMYNEDESVVVIFNGEIYNYQSLRVSLRRDGHSFATNCDTEVLVHLYEEYGSSLVDHLNGMFAFALYDRDEKRLVLARDQTGIKPLLLAQDGGRLAFASELPAILAAEMNLGGMDRTAIAQYFAYGYIPAPKTAFENATKVRPGELVEVTSDGVDRTRYHTLSSKRRSPGLEAAATELRQRVSDAVEKRLQSDVPLGAFLSGGIDSSIVVGLMSILSDEPVKTFTIGFDNAVYDESWAARTVAEYHGTDHHEFTLSPETVREYVPTVLDQLGEPFADQSLIPSYLVSKETSNEVKVALSGDGADELFAGYNKYLVESYSKYYRALPQVVRQRAVKPAVNLLPASRGSRLRNVAYQAQWFVNRAGTSERAARHYNLMRIPEDSVTDAFASIDPHESGRQFIEDQHATLPATFRKRNDLAAIQAVDLQVSLPNQMLQKVDLASMFNSLEVRVPFLDLSVIEYTQSLPTAYKISGRTRKRVLKRAFDDVLPDPILERGKQGFDMPIGEWFKNELEAEFLDALQRIDIDVLDTSAVQEAFDEHCSGRSDHGKFLWQVFVFKRWANRMRERGVL